MSRKWTAEDMPDLTGETIIVTGANSGIGFEAARHFALKGARTILACRNQKKGARALKDILAAAPEADVVLMELDLADLSSVRAFAAEVLDEQDAIDVLVNNAGVMAIPRRETKDGFEMQLGTNHLGHFALTGLLLERVAADGGGRVVNVSSMAHQMGKIRFDDLHGKKSYQKWTAYGQSKLANLLFTYELDRRVERAGLDVTSVACHPGYSATNLQLVGPQMSGSSLMEKMSALANKVVAQSAYMGALPTMYAAVAPDVRGGDYIGPDGLMEMRGHPKKVTSNAASHDAEVAAKLWEVSVQLTDVHYELLSPAEEAA